MGDKKCHSIEKLSIIENFDEMEIEDKRNYEVIYSDIIYYKKKNVLYYGDFNLVKATVLCDALGLRDSGIGIFNPTNGC